MDLGAANCSAGSCTYTVTGLTPDTYFFAVTAYDSAGNESLVSNETAANVN